MGTFSIGCIISDNFAFAIFAHEIDDEQADLGILKTVCVDTGMQIWRAKAGLSVKMATRVAACQMIGNFKHRLVDDTASGKRPCREDVAII